MKDILFAFALSIMLIPAVLAQGGPGGGGRNPSQMVEAEKEMVLDSLTNLNDDQKLIINEIYKDYEASITQLRASNSDDREAMRQQMTKLRDGKNESLEAILTEEQFVEYETLMAAVREQMRARRNNRND
jgi:Spy/CpxP family protein refolding chaperone